MSPEAQKYIIELYKQDPRKFFEFTSNSRNEITAAILNERSLTPTEIEKIHYFIKNGAPTLVMEFRGDGFDYQHIFIDESLIDRMSNPDEIEFAKRVASKPLMVKFPNKKPVEINFTELEQKHIEWSWCSRNDLKIRLISAEMEENYEECAQLQKYAESKGWDLKENKNE